MANNILTIGTGGCGNKLLNCFIDILNVSEVNNNYDNLFMNSNKNEMLPLENFDPKVNGLIVGGNGTGRNKTLGKQSIEKDKSKILNSLSRIIDIYDAVNVIFSMDGGFGSSSIGILSYYLRQLKPDLKINLLAIAPKLDSSEEALKNTLTTYSEILKLLGFTGSKNIVNGITIVDNEMMKNDVAEDEFNKEVMQLYLDSFECVDGGLDTNDQIKVANANGYRLPIVLDDRIPKLNSAIDISLNGSPFMLPSSFDNIFNGDNKILCSHLAGVLDSEVYNIDDWRNIFRVKNFDKVVDGELNFLVLGGLPMPTEKIDLYKLALKELQDIEINHTEEFNCGFNDDEIVISQKEEKVSQRTKKQNRRNKLLSLLESDVY